MLLVEVPWASRVWDLSFLSVLAPSERYATRRGERHKKMTEWAWQLLLLIRRWYPEGEIVAVADRAYASLELLDRCRRLRKPITFVARLRLDAALYESAPPRHPGQIGRPRLKGERLPNLSAVAQDPTAVWYSTSLFAVPVRWVLIRDPEGGFRPQALLCTDLDVGPEQVVGWYVMRWRL